MLTRIDLGPGYAKKLEMRAALYERRDPTPEQQRLLQLAPSFPYRTLAAALLDRHLSYEEAFAAGCYAVRASNGQLAHTYFGGLESFGKRGDELAARELLVSLAMKETWGGLTPDEVAGLVAAATLDIMRLPDYGPRAIETCGMGGDKGVKVPRKPGLRKTINSSTLSALVLAAMGYKAVKHGSYSNTSAMGSTEAVERLGLVVDYPDVGVQEQLAAGRFHYTDAHAWKTIHDLSHLQPRRETVNHVIGPMTVPVARTTRLDKVLGVSDKVKPRTIASAYAMLHRHGVLNMGNVAVVAGRKGKKVILDELSPWESDLAFSFGAHSVGIEYKFCPADFGVEFKDPYAVFVQNTADVIHDANLMAMAGADAHLGHALSDMLAMNAALALYVHRDLDHDSERMLHGRSPRSEFLRRCFEECRAAIHSGAVVSFLEDYKARTEELRRTQQAQASATV